MRLLLAFALVALARADEYMQIDVVDETIASSTISQSAPTDPSSESSRTSPANSPSSDSPSSDSPSSDSPSSDSPSSDSPSSNSPSSGSPSSGSTPGSPVFSTVVASTIAPTPQPFDVNTVVMPNAVTVQDAKHIYQEALVLTNHVQQLSAQLKGLQQSVDATNSPMITGLSAMATNATIMQGELQSLIHQLDNATAVMNATQASYANASRIYSCFWEQCQPAPTTTLPPTTTAYNCNQNLEATNSSSSFSLPTSSDVTCTQQIHSSDGGYLSISLDATIEGDASIVISDLLTTSQIEKITKSGSCNFNTSSTILGINVNSGANDTVGYSMEYYTVDPCDGFCNSTASCGMSAGQPYCFCNDRPCGTLNADGRSCTDINPCTSRNQQRCINQGLTCNATKDSNTCSYECVQMPTTTVDPIDNCD